MPRTEAVAPAPALHRPTRGLRRDPPGDSPARGSDRSARRTDPPQAEHRACAGLAGRLLINHQPTRQASTPQTQLLPSSLGACGGGRSRRRGRARCCGLVNADGDGRGLPGPGCAAGRSGGRRSGRSFLPAGGVGPGAVDRVAVGGVVLVAAGAGGVRGRRRRFGQVAQEFGGQQGRGRRLWDGGGPGVGLPRCLGGDVDRPGENSGACSGAG